MSVQISPEVDYVEESENAEPALGVDTEKLHRLELDPDTHPVPESIYGAGITYLVTTAFSGNGWIHGTTGMVVGSLVANIIIQVYVLSCIEYYIADRSVMKIQQTYSAYHEQIFDENGVFQEDLFHHWGDDKLQELCQFPFSQLQFFLCILIIWTAYLLIDLKETFYLMVVIWQLPPAEEGFVETNASIASSQAQMKQRRGGRGVKRVYNPSDGVVIETMNCSLKAFIAGLVLLPKLCIGIYLWWLGARWLAATASFQDLVLNALALAFITDLDEIVYGAMMPMTGMEVVTTYKIKRFRFKSRNQRLQANLGIMAFRALIIVGMPWLYIQFLQQVIPNYKFDIADHCEGYLYKYLTGEL